MSERGLFRYERFRGAMIGFLTGASLIRATESGGDWWIIFALLAIFIILTIIVPSEEYNV